MARFTARTTASIGNPNHGAGVDGDLRGTQQAEDTVRLADAARAMVTYHLLLSVGATAVPPPARAQFDGGAGAPAPTPLELGDLARRARTPTDHRALAEYYLTLQARETASANEHARMAETQRATGQRRGAEVAVMHCERLARLSRKAAQEAAAAASVQRQLASIG